MFIKNGDRENRNAIVDNKYGDVRKMIFSSHNRRVLSQPNIQRTKTSTLGR